MKCQECGKEVKIIKTRSGMPMRCDFGKVFFKEGNKDRLITLSGDVIRCEICHPLDDDIEGFGYIPHTLTCKRSKKVSYEIPEEQIEII